MVWELEYDEVDDDNQENIHRLDDDYDDDYSKYYISCLHVWFPAYIIDYILSAAWTF